MATLAFTDGFVSLGGTDVSTSVRSVTLNYSVEVLDETAMADTTRVNKGGLKNWSVDIEFNQDFVDDGLDEDIHTLIGTTGTVIVRPTSSAVGTGNPNYTGTGLFVDYTPIGNAVGDLATSRLRIVSAGTLSRATS
jgi:hypothetical protein